MTFEIYFFIETFIATASLNMSFSTFYFFYFKFWCSQQDLDQEEAVVKQALISSTTIPRVYYFYSYIALDASW